MLAAKDCNKNNLLVKFKLKIYLEIFTKAKSCTWSGSTQAAGPFETKINSSSPCTKAVIQSETHPVIFIHVLEVHIYCCKFSLFHSCKLLNIKFMRLACPPSCKKKYDMRLPAKEEGQISCFFLHALWVAVLERSLQAYLSPGWRRLLQYQLDQPIRTRSKIAETCLCSPPPPRLGRSGGSLWVIQFRYPYCTDLCSKFGIYWET